MASRGLNRFSSAQCRYSLPACHGPEARFANLLDAPRPIGPRIQDVAQRAGVAIGTISNVLKNPDIVTEQARVKVEATIAELNSVRNSAARALAARRST